MGKRSLQTASLWLVAHQAERVHETRRATVDATRRLRVCMGVFVNVCRRPLQPRPLDCMHAMLADHHLHGMARKDGQPRFRADIGKGPFSGVAIDLVR